MPKKRRKTDRNQLSVFDLLQELKEFSEQYSNETTEGTFKIIDQLKASMRAAIKSCPLDIYQIAGEMFHLLGQTITKDMIYSWTRASDEINGRPVRHIPAEFLPAFCKVTGSNDPLVIMGRLTGLFVLPGPEALRAEIQKLDEEIQRAKSRKKKRMMFLREMERNG